MYDSSQRIGLLTSGGDAPGMNAVIAGACDRLRLADGVPIAIRNGFAGLALREAAPMDPELAASHLSSSGTWLGTSRWPELRSPRGQRACVDAMASLGMHGLVVIGGNGSSAGARALARHLPVAFVPATIDQDVDETEVAIGTDSAIRYAVEVIERLRVTAASMPGRGFVVQTLGAPTGYLADAVAAAAGIEDVLVPERPGELDRLAERFRRLAADGQAIVVLSEAVGDAVRLSEELTSRSGVRVHPTILGHAQRAAAPSETDLVLGQAAGWAAIEALLDGGSTLISLGMDGRVTPRDLLSPAQPALLAETSEPNGADA